MIFILPAGLVLVGAMLGMLAFSLLPYLRQPIDNGDYVGMRVVLFVMLVIWVWASNLKEAEVPDDWKKQPAIRAPAPLSHGCNKEEDRGKHQKDGSAY
jgi:accessory gene regulator protein AgrB